MEVYALVLLQRKLMKVYGLVMHPIKSKKNSCDLFLQSGKLLKYK